MRRIIPSVLALCLAASNLVAAPKPNPKPNAKASAFKPAVVVGGTQVGMASWYGKPFHGRRTASGERYNMYQFTAAHRTLPLGTFIKVTNLENGRWIIARVTDRGPYVGRRVLDVSYGAAEMLDMRAEGVVKVRLDVLRAEPELIAASSHSELSLD